MSAVQISIETNFNRENPIFGRVTYESILIPFHRGALIIQQSERNDRIRTHEAL